MALMGLKLNLFDMKKKPEHLIIGEKGKKSKLYKKQVVGGVAIKEASQNRSRCDAQCRFKQCHQ